MNEFIKTEKDKEIFNMALKLFAESMNMNINDNFIGFKSMSDPNKRYCTAEKYLQMDNLEKFELCILSASEIVDFFNRV